VSARVAHRAGAGEPLLLLHGLGLTWRCWLPLLPALEAAHEVVAVDLPGFGDAPPLDGRAPTVEALSDAVEEALDGAGLGDVHVTGNSLGGWIGLELARRGRARSVVAIAPPGLELPPERAYVIAVSEALRARARTAAPVAPRLATRRGWRALMLGPMRGRPWRVPPSEAAAEVRALAAAPGFQRTLRWTVGAQVARGLDAVRVPVGLCYGTRDVMLAPFVTPRFAAAISQARLRVLPGCGHVPMADDPPLVARTVTDVTAPHRARARPGGVPPGR
jgi:pimeloyl-ACP methyl ester carboxylesterase